MANGPRRRATGFPAAANFTEPSNAFGDASGFVQQVAPDGTIQRRRPDRHGQAARRCAHPCDGDERHGRYFSDTDRQAASTSAC